MDYDIRGLIDPTIAWLSSTGLRILGILIFTFIFWRLTKRLPSRLMGLVINQTHDHEAKKRINTLSSLLNYILTVVLFLLAVVMILDALEIAIGPILAAAGVVGVALGFGAQHLVKDIISGFFILVDDQLRVGDVVKTAGKDGIVERVTLRMTVLRDFAGNVHYIPNGSIDTVTNMTKDYSAYVFDIGVAYRENVDEVTEIIKDVDSDLRADSKFASDIIEPIEVFGLDKFADSALILKARIKTKPIKQWRVAREFNRRLKIAFDEKGIEIPFPHMTLYAGQGKDGTAPPHFVQQKAEQ